MADLVDKPALRRSLRAIRDAIPADQRAAWSKAIIEQLLALPQVAAARSVFCYVSVGTEVDTRDLLQRLLGAGLRVSVPQVAGRELMHARQITSLVELLPGPFGIPAPPADSPILPAPDVAIVPGLAFTASGTRLGLGAGYYDRWLAAHPASYAVGLCYPPLLLNDLPMESHDIQVCRVVTPEM